MSQSDVNNYIVTFNNILHVDDASDGLKLAITDNREKALANFSKDNVQSKVRIIDGIWADDLVTSKISSVYEENKITIGDENDVLDMSVNTILAGKESGQTILYGKQLRMGCNNTDLSIYGSNVTVNDNQFVIKEESVSLNTSNVIIDAQNTYSVNTPSFDVNNVLVIDDSNVVVTGKFILAGQEFATSTDHLNFDFNNSLRINNNTNNIHLQFDENHGTAQITSTSNIQLTTDSSRIVSQVQEQHVTPNYSLTTPSNNTFFGMSEDDINVQSSNFNINTNFQINSDSNIMNHKSNILNSSVGEFHSTPEFMLNTGSAQFHINDNNTDFNTTTFQLTASDSTTINSTENVHINTSNFDVNNKLVVDSNNNTVNINTDTVNIKNNSLVLTNENNIIANSTQYTVSASQSETHNTPQFNINTPTENAYLNIDKQDGNATIKTSTNVSITSTNTSNIASNYIKNVAQNIEFNNTADKAYMKLTKSSGVIDVGNNKTVTTNIKSTNINLNSTETHINSINKLFLNNSSDGAFLKLDKNLSQATFGSSALATMNIASTILDINNPGDNVNIHLNKQTSNLQFKSDNTYINKDDNTEIFVDKPNSEIHIGKSELESTYLHGKNVFIGEPGQTTTIYGNIVTYSEGSNIVMNTITENTAAFQVQNTGTDIALLVQQNNAMGSDQDVAQFITHDDQDRTALRIDGSGRVGVGMSKTSNMDAWFHVTRKDPDESDMALMRVDDYENDTTPFIIENDGNIGIGTISTTENSKLDIHGDTRITNASLTVSSNNQSLTYTSSNIYRNGTNILHVDENNNNYVGIHKTNANYALDVNGDIAYSGVLYSNSVDVVDFINTNIATLDDKVVAHSNQFRSEIDFNTMYVETTENLLLRLGDATSLPKVRIESSEHVFVDSKYLRVHNTETQFINGTPYQTGWTNWEDIGQNIGTSPNLVMLDIQLDTSSVGGVISQVVFSSDNINGIIRVLLFKKINAFSTNLIGISDDIQIVHTGTQTHTVNLAQGTFTIEDADYYRIGFYESVTGSIFFSNNNTNGYTNAVWYNGSGNATSLGTNTFTNINSTRSYMFYATILTSATQQEVDVELDIKGTGIYKSVNVPIMTVDSSNNIGLNTNNTDGYNLYVNGTTKIDGDLTVNGNVVPDVNDSVDLGTPGNRFRDLYLSENSIWLGDTHKIDVNHNKIRFRKRKTDVMPVRLQSHNLVDPTDSRVTLPNGNSKTVTNLTLDDIYGLARQNDVITDKYTPVNNLFVDDDFEDNTPAITWADNTIDNNIYYTKGSVGIGLTAPAYTLDVAGDINYAGTLTSNGIDLFQKVQDQIDYELTYLQTDRDENRLDIGGSNLDTITIDADDITIGREGGVTKILGDFIAYGSGSNIVVDTVTQETTAFLVKNMGTESALIVQQTNELGSNNDVAQFITHDTIERAALRIDGDGRIGVGMSRESNIEAWMHVSKLDPYDSDIAMLRVDDNENDTTPFIVTHDGSVGVNTSNPQYNLDVEGNLNYTGLLTSNGLDLVDYLEDKMLSGTMYVYPDVDKKELLLGDDTVEDLKIIGNNVTIGTPGGVTTILGDFVSYSSGSNIVVNTVTQETSSFYINNVGTDVGLLVKQENVMGSNMDIVRFETNEDPGRSAMRVDYEGRMGLGMPVNCNLDAWMHISRKDPYDCNTSMLRIDDVDNDTTPFIVLSDGKVGVNKEDPVTELEVGGTTQTTELIAGTVLGELVSADDDFIKWDFRDAGCNIVNYGTCNIMFNANIYNFNKRIVDSEADSMSDVEKNLMIWYKFSESANTSCNVTNFAEFNNDYSYDPDTIPPSQIEELDVIKRVRGNYGIYMLYIDTDQLLSNGDAYIYPNERDVPSLLTILENGFSFSVFVRVEDTTLPSVSLLSVKTNDDKTLLHIRIIEDGIIEFTVSNDKGQMYTIRSSTPITEQKDTNYIFIMDVDSDTKDTHLSIFKSGFIDSEVNISGFTPVFNVPDVFVRFCNNINSNISPIFLRELRIFKRTLSQEEIYGINDRDKFGNINRNVHVSADADYLMHIKGNMKVNESLVINNGVVHKIFFSTGGNVFTGTNNNSLCKLGISISWKNNLSDYFDIASYIFRLSCKFHACTSSDSNAISYRKFEAFISPKDDPLNNLPGNVVTTETSDTVSSTMSIRDTIIERRGATKVLLLIEFKNFDNVNNTLRGYIDCDLLASSELGLFTLESYTDLDGKGFIF